MRTKVAVASAAVLLVLAGCASSDDTAGTDPSPTTAAETAPGETAPGETAPGEETAPEEALPTPPEPDLEGVPEVVAEVDGVEITRDEFARVYEGQLQQAFFQAQMTGEEIDQEPLRQQTVEGMVDTELLLLEAAERGIAPSQEELDAAAEELAAGSGLGSAEELFAALEEQGLAPEEAMVELEQQTALNQLLAEEAGDFSPSEEELRALYDEAVAQAPPGAEGAEVPEFEEVRPQLEDQLRQQQEGEAAQALVAELRENADITIHL